MSQKFTHLQVTNIEVSNAEIQKGFLFQSLSILIL